MFRIGLLSSVGLVHAIDLPQGASNSDIQSAIHNIFEEVTSKIFHPGWRLLEVQSTGRHGKARWLSPLQPKGEDYLIDWTSFQRYASCIINVCYTVDMFLEP